MAEEKTIEQKAAETILQTPVEVKVGSKTYMTAPPSTATLILASEAVSRLPHVVLDPKNVVEEKPVNRKRLSGFRRYCRNIHSRSKEPERKSQGSEEQRETLSVGAVQASGR